MSILRVRQIPLSKIIKFGSEQEPFDLIDITSDVDVAHNNVFKFVNSPGSFIYETKFTVNESEAFKQGVTGIRFEFFDHRPSATSIARKENDFTIEIKQPAPTDAHDPPGLQKAVVSLQAPELKNLTQVMAPVKAISQQQAVAPMPFNVAAKKSEKTDRQDPAQLLSSGRVLGTTPKNILNFSRQSQVPDQKSQNFDRVGPKSSDRSLSLSDRRATLSDARKNDKNPIVDSFLNLKRVEKPNTLVRTLPVAVIDVMSDNVEYTRQLTLNKSNFQGCVKIYCRVSGIIRDNAVASIEKRQYVIAHSAEINDLLGNPEPPVIRLLESQFGKVSFSLTRSDPTLRRVSVVRVTKNPNMPRAVFENVGDVEFGASNTEIYRDDVDNVEPNTVIYRFIVKNENGTNSDFTSVVIPSFTKVSDQKKAYTANTPISIRALNTRDGIEISVDTVNDQVYSLRLLRQDMGAIGEFADSVKTILDPSGRYTQIVAGEKKTIEFLDTQVVTGRHYRYFAAYRLRADSEASLCLETISDEDESIVRYLPSSRLPFTAEVTPALATQDDKNALTVQFDMQVKEIEEQYNVLLDTLRQAGVSQQFITDLQNDRQKARQVAAFLVERVDRVSGRRVSFGIVPPGKFLDSPETRSKLGLPDPLPGRKYEYICKLCIRPPNTFLLTATMGFTATGDTSGNITEVLATKFQNALIGRGIIPSERQLRDGASIRENFFLGMTGLEKSSTVLLPRFDPKVENLTVKKKKYFTMINWATSGDVSNISYFLIYCNYNGTNELLGTVSAVGRNAKYQYKDMRFCNEVGKKSYFVKLVTLDHDESVTSASVEATTDASVSLGVLDGAIYVRSIDNKDVKLTGIPSGLSSQSQKKSYDADTQKFVDERTKLVNGDISDASKIAVSKDFSKAISAFLQMAVSGKDWEQPPTAKITSNLSAVSQPTALGDALAKMKANYKVMNKGS